ncbi:hypothetical protein [Planococcus dechangensis]|uniref:Uncharacterized protein n=1 Tax=Planococcus dechangensis TaxID=1176255 RepID=A0ABV9MEE2_9BACL
MKSIGITFLIMSVVFWVISLTSDQAPILGIVFMTIGITYFLMQDEQENEEQ